MKLFFVQVKKGFSQIDKKEKEGEEEKIPKNKKQKTHTKKKERRKKKRIECQADDNQHFNKRTSKIKDNNQKKVYAHTKEMEQEKPTTITVGTETSYWEQILNQVYSADEKGSNGTKKSLIEARKRVVVLGDRGSGKSALFRRSIAAAAEQAIPKGYGSSGSTVSSEKGCGFSYNLGYFGGFRGDEDLDNFFGEGGDYDVNEDDDDSAFAGVFEIGSLEQAPTLLNHAIPSEAAFKNSIFVIVVNPVCSARRGYTPALASLTAWADVIRKFATEKGYIPRNTGLDVSIDAIKNNKAITTFSQFNRIQNYIFSRTISQSSSSSSSSNSNGGNGGEGGEKRMDEEEGGNLDVKVGGAPAEATVEELVSLSEVLCDNIGVPVVVSLSKVDSDAMLPQKGGLVVGNAEQESTFEFLSVVRDYLRVKCLSLGAGLVFNSERKNRNIDVLYAYIGYLLFGFKVGFRPQANVADSVFIPSGWDSKSKVAFEFEAKKISMDESFGAVVRNRFNKEAGGNDADTAKDSADSAAAAAAGGRGEDVLDSRMQSDQEFLRLLKNKLESTPVYGDDGSIEYAVPSSSPAGSAPAVSPTLTTTLNFRSLRRKDAGAAAAVPPSNSPQ